MYSARRAPPTDAGAAPQPTTFDGAYLTREGEDACGSCADASFPRLALGVMIRPGPASEPAVFIPAIHIGAHVASRAECRRRADHRVCKAATERDGRDTPSLGERLRACGSLDVSVDEGQLRELLGGRQLTPAKVMHPSEPVAVPLCVAGWRTLFAWVVNLAMLLTATAWLLLILCSLLLLPSNLEAQSLSHSDWLAAFGNAVGLCILGSLLLVDGIKVLVITILDLPDLDARLRSHRLTSLLLRKPLRRLHQVLDVCL